MCFANWPYNYKGIADVVCGLLAGPSDIYGSHFIYVDVSFICLLDC